MEWSHISSGEVHVVFLVSVLSDAILTLLISLFFEMDIKFLIKLMFVVIVF